MSKVLLLTTDPSFKRFINLTMSFNSFTVHSSENAQEAWKLLSEIRFDFVMVDYHLKNESGLAFYKSIRQFGLDVPVLMIGEGKFDEFMLKELSPVHYDYLLKPFKFEALRVKANRLLEMNSSVDRLIACGELKIDVKQQIVMVKDRIIQLGKLEMKILLLLAKKTGEVVDPRKIKSLLEAEGEFYNMTPFFYVSKLRQKLKKLAGEAFDISLIGGEGYRLVYRT